MLATLYFEQVTKYGVKLFATVNLGERFLLGF